MLSLTAHAMSSAAPPVGQSPPTPLHIPARPIPSEMLSLTHLFRAVCPCAGVVGVRADAARLRSAIPMMEGRRYVGWVYARREVASPVAVGHGRRGGHGDRERVAHD